jgi:hypothetical protein
MSAIMEPKQELFSKEYLDMILRKIMGIPDKKEDKNERLYLETKGIRSSL